MTNLCDRIEPRQGNGMCRLFVAHDAQIAIDRRGGERVDSGDGKCTLSGLHGSLLQTRGKHRCRALRDGREAMLVASGVLDVGGERFNRDMHHRLFPSEHFVSLQPASP